jgi:hypothetical protein
LLEKIINLKISGGISMSHSRSKGHRQQQRHQEPTSQEWNRYADRFGNPGGESEFQGSREYRENPRYGPQQEWRSDWRTDDMNRGRWESGMESHREPERQRSNVTRFGQRREGKQQSFAGRGPQGYKRSDERITEDINEELTQDPELDASDVNIEVRSGEVVLKGTVPDRASKRRAEEIAEYCSGVKDVMNQLRIKRDESSDSENSSRRDKEDKRNKVAS